MIVAAVSVPRSARISVSSRSSSAAASSLRRVKIAPIDSDRAPDERARPLFSFWNQDCRGGGGIGDGGLGRRRCLTAAEQAAEDALAFRHQAASARAVASSARAVWPVMRAGTMTPGSPASMATCVKCSVRPTPPRSTRT